MFLIFTSGEARIFDGRTTGVVQVGHQKFRVALDSVDDWSPQLLPAVGDVQDVLHENLYVDKDPVGLEILGDILFVLSTVVLLGFIHIRAQLLQDGHPFGEWS